MRARVLALVLSLCVVAGVLAPGGPVPDLPVVDRLLGAQEDPTVPPDGLSLTDTRRAPDPSFVPPGLQKPPVATLEALRKAAGPDGFDPGPAVPVPRPVTAEVNGNGTASSGFGPVVDQGVGLDDNVPHVLKDRPAPATIAAGERVGFGAGQARSDAKGQRLVAPGTAVAGAKLGDKVRLVRPVADSGVEVSLVTTDDALTRQLSTIGLGFSLQVSRAVGAGKPPVWSAAAGRKAGQPIDLGVDSGWALEFDFGFFESAGIDPTGVKFAINLDCKPNGVCSDREWLTTTYDRQTQIVTMVLPENVLAAFAARKPTASPAAAAATTTDSVPAVESTTTTPPGSTTSSSGATTSTSTSTVGSPTTTATSSSSSSVGSTTSSTVPAVSGSASGGAGFRVGISFSPGIGMVAQQGGSDPGDYISGLLSATSDNGNFAAAQPETLTGWQVGLPSGHAELSYPIQVPDAPGPDPDLTLQYSSGLVDAMNGSANTQPSRAGVGWSEPTALISREVGDCSGNICALYGRLDGFSISFGGVSSPLIRTSPAGGETDTALYPTGTTKWEYVLQTANDWRVRRVEQTGQFGGANGNGDQWTTWWEVTTADGTLYVFGREKVFDPTSGTGPATTWKRAGTFAGNLESTQSAHLWFPVADRTANCTAQGYCPAGVTWNLDQVIDTSGNMAIYYYGSEVNYFKPSGAPASLWYDREVYLRNVHYGLRYDTTPPVQDGAPPFRVKVEYQDRTSGQAPAYPDTPKFDCTAAGTEVTCQTVPSFYSTRRLWKYSLLIGGVGKNAWYFYHSWPAAADGSDRKLWLDEIRRYHTVAGGGEVQSLPQTTFTKTWLANRVVPLAPSNKSNLIPRVGSMTSAGGGTVTFTYGQTHPPSPTIGSACYQLNTSQAVRQPCDMYQASGSMAWWNKWKVTQTSVDPIEGGSQTMVTQYQYPVAPDWAWASGNTATTGSWSDYRGHRQVKVLDGSGAVQTLYFYTGMWDDRNGITDETKLGTVSSTAPAKVTNSAGTPVDNRLPLTGRSLGTEVHRGIFRVHRDIPTYALTAITPPQPSATVPSLYEDPYRLDSVTTDTEIYNQPDVNATTPGTWSYIARIKQAFDTKGRPTQTTDYGRHFTAGNTTTTFNTDDRTTDLTYTDVTTPWLMAQVMESKTRVGSPTTTLTTTFASTTFLYDALGRVSETNTQRASGNTNREKVQFTYNTNGQPTIVKRNGDNAVATDDQPTTYGYDPTYGWLASVNGPLNGDVDKRLYVVDPAIMKVTSETDPNGAITTYTYDPIGRITSARLPGATADSYRFTYGVDQFAADWVKTEKRLFDFGTDQYSSTWTFYDGLGRTIQTRNRHQDATLVPPQMAVVSTRYDQVGRPWEQTEPEWIATATVGAYEAEAWATPNSPRSTFAYPIYSNHSYVTNAGEGCRAGANTEVSYRTGTGTEWARSASTVCGLEQRNWDRDVKFTKVITDVRGNPLTSRDPAGGTSTFVYNLRDQVTSVTDAGNATTTYTYTNWGIYGPSSTVDPDKGTTSYTYDLHGRLATRTDARAVTLTYAYDLANRPTTIKKGTTTVSSFTYDFAGAFGRLRQAQTINLPSTGTVGAGTVTQTYGYDNRGQLTGVTYDIPGLPGGAKTINYSYYEGGQPFKTLYPNGTEIENGYARDGQPFWIGLTDPNNNADLGQRTVVDYASYNARGQIDGLYRGHLDNTRPSDKQLNTTYLYRDVDGLPSVTHTESSTGAVAQQFVYSFSNAGRAEWIYEQAPTGSNRSCFQYDTNNHLTKAWTLNATLACTTPPQPPDTTGPEPYNVAYTYDNIGRITSANGTGTVNGTYTYETGTTKPDHAPLTAGTKGAFTYDLAGNRTGGGGITTYTYDALNRMATTTGNAPVTSAMLYDAAGERVKRTVGGTTTYYLAAGLEIASNGNTTISINLGGKPVATYTPDKNIWFQNADHLGSATYTTTTTQTQEKYRRYTPFGEPRSASSDPAGGTPSDLGFTNQRDDGALNLTYYGARYYDPQTAQFTQPDPAITNPLNTQDRNRYAYVRNNPLTHTDPTGNLVCDDPRHCMAPSTIGKPPAPRTTTPRPVAVIPEVIGSIAPTLPAVNLDKGPQAPPVAPPQGGSSVIKGAVVVGFGLAILALTSTLPPSGGSPPDDEDQPQRPAVAVDTNILNYGIINHDPRVDIAIAGRRPVVSPKAVEEFLAEPGRSMLQIIAWLVERDGHVGSPADLTLAGELRSEGPSMRPRRVLHEEDSEILASAIADGLTLLTNDDQFYRFMIAGGYPAEHL